MFRNLIASALKPQAYKPVRLDRSVTIGMAAHGSAAISSRALDHLFSSVRGDYELILVDDASPDDTLKVFRDAKRSHDNVRIFSFSKNLEYCESVNSILSHAAGEFVFFVSNDVFVTPAYLRELIATLRANAGCGIARGCANFVDGHAQPHNLLNRHYQFESKSELFEFAEALAKINRHRVATEDPYLTGDAFAVARRTIDRIGGFDTRFIGYFGDVDYGLRSRGAGLMPMVNARAFAYHNSDANMTYLDSAERDKKVQRRFTRVRAAYQEFLAKYPVDVSGFPGDSGALDQNEFLHVVAQAKSMLQAGRVQTHVPLKDYSEYLVT